MTSVTDPAGNIVAYEWGSMNEKLRLTYPDGQEAIYAYNKAGMFQTIRHTGNTL